MTLPYHNTSPESSALIASKAGKLHSLTLVNVNASPRYAFVFKGQSSAGTRVAVIPLAGAGGGNTRDFVDVRLPYGLEFDNGIFVGSSSTKDSYTAAGGTDLWIDAEGRDA